MKTFKVGDVVRWTSQAAGITKTKEGSIVQIVPSRKSPKDFGYKSKDGWGSGTRHEQSYVVLVNNTKRPRKAYYWPHASKLELVLSAKTTGKVIEVPEVESPKKNEVPPMPTPSTTFTF